MKKIITYFFIFGVGLIISIMVGLMGVKEVSADDGADEDEAEEVSADLPELFIRAISPGYKIDGVNNVGEMIEIARRDADDTPISLAGFTVSYTNSSGNETVLLEFPENSWIAGEAMLLRLASSPEHELAALNYTKTLAMKGSIALIKEGEAIDAVCWTGKDDCYKYFSSTKPTTLVRNLASGEFEHWTDYEPMYEADSFYLEMAKEEEGYGQVASQCKGLKFSEILSYYETDVLEQFIEFYNDTAEQILLDGCQIKYKNKVYVLGGIVKAEEYFVYYPKGFRLTKNPTNVNTLELIDVNGETVDKLEYPNGQRKGTAYAWIGYDDSGKALWRTTYAPTPGAPNNYQEYRTCEEGKVINKATGNCVKVTAVTTKICKEGQYLNILTGRCKKIETTEEKVCKEGYYLNPETNRCRKIKENKGADYSLEPENYEENSSFVALYAVLGVVGVGVLYALYEFRHGWKKLWQKVFRRFH